MSDRQPVGGAQQPDHHLGAIRAPVTAVAERLGREPLIRATVTFEVGRREVVADQGEVHVRQVAQRRVQLGLGRLLRLGDGVEGAVVLIGRRRRETGGHHHVGLHPFGQPPLRARVDEPVGDHRQHGVAQQLGAAPLADGGEPAVQPQPAPHRIDRRHRAERRGGLRGEPVDGQPATRRVGGQGGDDPVELTAGAQRAGFAEAEQDPVTDLAADARGLHQ